MATELLQLKQAWSALKNVQKTDAGWQMIQISERPPVGLLAGVSFPEVRESLIFDFYALRLPAAQVFPQGQGFEISRITDEDAGVRIALSCLESRNLDLFLLMAEDILDVLSQNSDQQNTTFLFRCFLDRVTAWQIFMSSRSPAGLNKEQEQGLFAELVFLEEILNAGVPIEQAVEIWKGPLEEGIQDFITSTGAVEVKSTLAANGFQAEIFSLQQLDTDYVQPLFMAALRLSLSSDGYTLPQQILRVRQQLENNQQLQNIFSDRLLHAGYTEAQAQKYQRRFRFQNLYCLKIEPDFPRLTKSSVPAEVIKARYTLDLSASLKNNIGLEQCLKTLGVIHNGTD